MNDAQIASELGSFGVDVIAISRKVDVATAPLMKVAKLDGHAMRFAGPAVVEVLSKKSLCARYRLRGHGHIADRLHQLGRRRGWIAFVFESDVEGEANVDETTPIGMRTYFRKLAVATTMMSSTNDRG